MDSREKNVCTPPESGAGDAGGRMSPAEVEAALSRIRRLRKQRNLYGIAGVLAILVLLVLFLSSLYTTAKKFDPLLCGDELVRNSSIITSSHDFKAIGEDFRDLFIPLLKAEIFLAFEKELPNLKKQGERSLGELEKYVMSDLKKRILERLAARLEKLERKIVSKYDAKKADSIEKAFQKLNAKFMDEAAVLLEKQLSGAIDSLGALDAKIQLFKKSQEYLALAGTPSAEIESRLLETFLELWIYQLDPAKGNSPFQTETMQAKGNLK